MYKITTTTGETHLTERATWIRVHPNGNAYLLCEKSKAAGIAYHGTPYLFKDGNTVTEVDIGADILAAQETEALTLELAAATVMVPTGAAPASLSLPQSKLTKMVG